MTATSGQTSERPPGRDVMNATKYDLGGQCVLVLARGWIVAEGLAFNWSR